MPWSTNALGRSRGMRKAKVALARKLDRDGRFESRGCSGGLW